MVGGDFFGGDKKRPSYQSLVVFHPMKHRSSKWDGLMAITLEKIKRDFAKHRAKSAILGVLGVVMVGLFVKAAEEMRPRTAVADPMPGLAAAGAEVTPEAAAEAEAQDSSIAGFVESFAGDARGDRCFGGF